MGSGRLRFSMMKIQAILFWVVTLCIWRQQGPPKHWYPTAKQHCISSQPRRPWHVPKWGIICRY